MFKEQFNINLVHCKMENYTIKYEIGFSEVYQLSYLNMSL